MATTTYSAGNDVIAAHSDADYLKGQLVFVLGATPAQGAWPTPNILINGQVVAANVLVSSYVIAGNTQVVSVPLPAGPITSVGIQFWNDLVITGGEDRNLYVGSVTLNGTTIPLASGTYVMTDFPTTAGRSDMNWNGTMTWSGATVANAVAGGTSAESQVIDGGAGVDVVTYAGREKSFVVGYTSSGAITVGSNAVHFGDALWSVENVLFDDRGAYAFGGGFDAAVDMTSGTIDGGRGIDTLMLKGNHTQYFIQHTSTGFSISGNGINEWVTNVERLQFEDGWVGLDTAGDAGQAYRLYQAAFDRAPDLPGLGFQIDRLDSGLSLSHVAGDFIASPEFQSKYGGLTDSAYVSLLYQNVLHRTAQQFEIDYHVNNELHAGYSRADVLTFFSESPENQGNVAAAIQDGMFFTFG